jgi:signal transduction histidine kinase/ActR/RegA family two-component response regulator
MQSAAGQVAWHQKLGAQVIIGAGLLIALSLTAIAVTTTRAVSARAFEVAANDLALAHAAFRQLIDDRAEFVSTQAALVTTLPVFRAHFADSRLLADEPTMGVLAEQYRRELDADFAVITNARADWLAAAGWPGSDPGTLRAAVDEAINGRSGREILAAGDRLFLVVSEPASFAEETLGTFTVGYWLNDAVARRLADVARCEVNLIGDDRLFASSLTGSGREEFAGLERTRVLEGDLAGRILRVGSGEYAVGHYPLVSASGRDTTLVLLQDWGPTRQFLNGLQLRLLASGAIIFLLAMGGGLLHVRRVSRPLQSLADAADDVAAGNWARQVPVGGAAEVTVVARAFNRMTQSLRHWFDEAKRRDDQLRHAQKMEAIGRLAGGVAHDFNNLLSAIRGNAELLIEALEPDDARRGDAEEIVKAAERCAALTRQLLAFSRRHVVNPAVVDLNQVVANARQLLDRFIGEDVALTVSAETPLRRVRADVGQIEQVLVNLAVNARDAMPTGGSLRIDLHNVDWQASDTSRPIKLPEGRYVRLSVWDTGAGMDPETAARIFEPFFTTKEEGRGTGLGLSIVYGIVAQAGGEIVVDTAPGRGAAFHIYLPETTDEEPVRAPVATAPGPVGGVETVLLVEDDSQVRAFVADALRRVGYTVLEASRGAEAIELAATYQSPIHLLLTDVVMSGMNGRELSEHITRLRGNVRVLFMSGYSDDAMLRHGVQTATAHLIEKPFSVDALRVKIREVIASARAAPA